MAGARAANPIAPYEWVAVYADGTRLRQFEADRRHASSDIDPIRLALVMLEGPGGPIRVPVSWTLEPLVAVQIRARVRRRLGDPLWEERRVQVEYTYRSGALTVTLTADDRLDTIWEPHG